MQERAVIGVASVDYNESKLPQPLGDSFRVVHRISKIKRVQFQVVLTAPEPQLLLLLSVCRLITIRLQTSGASLRGAVICKEGDMH